MIKIWRMIIIIIILKIQIVLYLVQNSNSEYSKQCFHGLYL